MALYEDETQTPWDKELARYGNEPPMSAGTITNETTGQTTDVPMASRPQQMSGEQPGQMPPGGDVNQFLDWVIKNKIGFNPFTMNPTTDAIDTWNKNESKYFDNSFSGTGITSSNMTPEALKFWNEQRKEGMAALTQEAQQRQRNAAAYIGMLKQGWEEANTVAGKLELATGEKALINKFGQKIRNSDAIESGSGGSAGLGQMVAGRGAPSGGGEYLTEPAKKEKGDYQIVDTSKGFVRVNKNDPKDVTVLDLKKPMTGEQQTTLKNLVDIQMINDWIYNNYVKEGAKKDSDKYTGAGGYAGKVQKIGGAALGYTEEQSEFTAKVAQLYRIVYGLSGKQINKEELVKLAPFIPEVTDSDVDFRSKVKQLRETLQQSIDNTIEISGRSGTGFEGRPSSSGDVGGIKGLRKVK